MISFSKIFSCSSSIFVWRLLIIGILFFGVACSEGEMDMNKTTFKSLNEVPEAVWQKLSSATIFFGHQSVGDNILDGIKDIMAEHPRIALNISATTEPANIQQGSLTHYHIGQNQYPLTKIDELRKVVQNGVGKKADFILFKMCYVDISPSTDIDKLFAIYQQTLAEMQTQFPHTRFVHFTVPLETTNRNIKYYLKRLIGRVDANIARNEFNTRLREAYGNKEIIFDLARIESTYSDGTQSTFTSKGNTYYSLAPNYTYDTGHLNALGRKIVAEQLLILLSRMVS